MAIGVQLLRVAVGALLVVGSGAAALYQGCSPKHHGVPSSTLPNLVVIGVQKGGTTSLGQALHDSRSVCWTRRSEMHFFDQPRFRNHSVNPTDLRAYGHEWARCHQGQIRAEKTPRYYLVPRVALHVCESLHSPAIAIVLREPAQRAFSSFFQGMHSDGGPALLKVPNDVDGFDQVARLDVAITRGCGGLPTAHMLDGVPSARERHVFQTCCERVARVHGRAHWPGCACEKNNRRCVPFGELRAMPVRMGVYAPYLRQWFVRHRASSIRVIDFDELIADMEGTVRSLVRMAKTPASARREVSDKHGPSDTPHGSVHLNSKAAGREMHNSTARMLRAFYAPFEPELFALIGRRMHGWGGGASGAS